jgi:hypothetical protein
MFLCVSIKTTEIPYHKGLQTRLKGLKEDPHPIKSTIKPTITTFYKTSVQLYLQQSIPHETD